MAGGVLGANSQTLIIYVNGLGCGKIRKPEELSIRHLRKSGFTVEHAPINWYGDESFQSVLERIVDLVEHELRTRNRVVLVGASAGGSVVFGAAEKVKNPNLQAIALCSRLNEKRLARWDPRNLSRMSHLGSPRASQIFYDSVLYCTNSVIPSLTKQDKSRFLTVIQWADMIVPRKTMVIDGVRVRKLPVIGHLPTIVLAMWRLPKIMQNL